MEGFNYIDLFDTKGIEYLLVISFLVTLILFWRYLNKPAKKLVEKGMQKTAAVLDWFRFREEIFHHQGHSWARPLSNDIVLVGVDDFAQRLLGKPVTINLPKIGSRLEQGEIAWDFQIDSKKINLLSPVNGKVVEINQKILQSPGLINENPYEDGWLLKVKVPNLKSNLKNLLTGKMAKAWMNETIKDLRSRMTDELGLALQDGGIPVSGFAKVLSNDHWDELAAEFLLTK
jgi:glycine cleavage system H protein